MKRILGIDPGSQITGFGLISVDGPRTHYLDCGCIRTSTSQSVPERLKTIYTGLCEVIASGQPDAIAVEQVFMHRNPDSALKLGQARGVALCAGALAGVPISEYAPRAIKQAIVGKGNAGKHQVQHMVRALLHLAEQPQADAADALAVALCHGHTLQTNSRLQAALAGAGRRR